MCRSVLAGWVLILVGCGGPVVEAPPCPGGVEVESPEMCVYSATVVEAPGFLCPTRVPALVRYGEVAACRVSDEPTTEATDAVRTAAQDHDLGEVDIQSRWGNPYFGDPERASAGKSTFGKLCSGCHGEDALDDPLKEPAGNLGVAIAEGIGDDEIENVVRQGRLMMPDFEVGQLSEEEFWEVVTFLRTLS